MSSPPLRASYLATAARPGMGDNLEMADRVCHHCKRTVSEAETHDCWTTTEAALTKDLSEDLREAWERLRETAVSFGDQRIYASHKSIMFSRNSCYFFVRPEKKVLELCLFLRRALESPHVRRVDQASKSKVVHIIHINHRDQVEPPITDWLREAYEVCDEPSSRPAEKPQPKPTKPSKVGQGISPPAKSRNRP